MEKLRASSAPIWAVCPGSTHLPVAETEPKDTKKEGDICHRLVFLLGTGVLNGKETVAELETLDVIKTSGFELRITEELYQLAQEAFAWAMTQTNANLKECHWEEELTELLPDGVAGTPDFIGYERQTRTLHVIDFKFGYVPVLATDNRQLLVYALGALKKYHSRKVENLALHIFQPRDYINGAFKTWKLGMTTDWPLIETEVIQGIQRAWAVYACGGLHPDAFQTGAHCVHCDRRPYCGSFLVVVNSILETPVPVEACIPVGCLGSEYEYLKRAEAYIVAARKGLEDHIMHRLKNGKPVTGWTLGIGKGRRKLNAPLKELKAIEAMTGAKLVEEKPVSVSKAWANVAARPLLETVIEKTTGATKLVPYDPEDAKEMFEPQ
jgi:hypothetical protein